MVTLCMDTAHKYLVVGLLRDDTVIDGLMTLCWKKQSEMILPEIDRLMKKNGLLPADIDQIVITRGPGSFTGVRIAMTIAKVLGTLTAIKVYTVSTLQLYAADHKALVVLDARGGRCYCGCYDHFEGEDQVVEVAVAAEQMTTGLEVIGDGSLIGAPDHYPDIVACFLKCRPVWQLVSDIATLTPVYLKNKNEYQPNI